MNVAVVGGGLVGLTAALRLSQAGEQVTLFERAPRLGGLATAFEVGGTPLECYYHHVFTHDEHLRRLAEELGLGPAIRWLPSKVAVFDGEALHPFQTPLDLLRFPGLSLPERLRFGVATLWARRLKDWKRLESLTAREWLTSVFGEKGYRAIWRPLLEKKFGAAASSVSAVWIWNKIALRGSSRAETEERELLGYMTGSFQRLSDRMAEVFAERGGRIELGRAIGAIRRDGAHWRIDDGAEAYDAVVLAVPPATATALLGEDWPAAERETFAALEHTGAMVAVLELDRPLTDYYWININADDVPFGGLIEHTNLLSPQDYGGRHIVYLSRYLATTDAFWSHANEAALEAFLAVLPRFNPAFDRAWVQASHVFRAPYAQPIIPRDYGRRLPPTVSAAPGLYFGMMHHIYPEDRGMNYAIGLGDRLAREVRQTASRVVPAADAPIPSA